MRTFLIDDFGRPLIIMGPHVYQYSRTPGEWWADYPMSSQLLWDKLPHERWQVTKEDFGSAFYGTHKMAYDPNAPFLTKR